MKILLIHRYFWPDTPPYAVILKKIASRLADDGHDVQVLSTQPSYKPDVKLDRQQRNETLDGFQVRRFQLIPNAWRIPGKALLNMLLFSFAVIFHALRRRNYDVIMISTSPPVLAGWAARIASKICGSKMLYHCMDIHPEIGRLSGEFRNPTIYNFLERTDNKTCQKAANIIVLSEDMKQAILERDGAEGCQIEVIQNFNLNTTEPDGDNLPPVPAEFKKSPDMFRLIFAGNIGRFQGLPLLVETFAKLKDSSNLELVLLGEGSCKQELKDRVEQLGATNVLFLPHQPMAVANQIIQTADLGIVSLNPDVFRYAYPTKMIGYLSVGCPLLSMIEPQSALAAFVKTNKIGINITPGDHEALQAELDRIKSDPQCQKNYRANAKQVYASYYGETQVLDRWSKMINELEPSDL